MKKLLKIIWNNFYLRNIMLFVAMFVVVIIIVFLFLKVYTRHGQALAVPDLYGYTIESAEEVLTSRKLDYEVIDSVYITNEKKGVIVDQIPKAEYKLKKDRTIFLTINAHTSEMVAMPNVVGYSFRQANAVLNTRGLAIGRLIYVPDPAKNMVLKQKIGGRVIHEGDTVAKGSMVDLEIGNGLSNQKVKVPYLITLRIDEAKGRLNRSYLNMGAEIYDNSVVTDEDTALAFVFRQKPDPDNGRRLPMGSFIDVWLTIDSTKLPGYDSLLNSMKINEQNIYVED